MSISQSNGNRGKQRLLEKIKESENAQNRLNQHIKKKSKHVEGANISKLEKILLPRTFPHIFGNKIPIKRSETIDMYMHFTPSNIEDPVAARKHAKNEMFQGMERLKIIRSFGELIFWCTLFIDRKYEPK